MLNLVKRGWTQGLSIILIFCILSQFFVVPAQANDRSAAIIGSRPLLVERLLTPAGLSGKGQRVGLADSGLDKGSLSDIHPDLQTEPGAIPRVAMLGSYTDRGIADDPNGHGTFMAATIVGSGQASQGQFEGIAPGASLYFQALLDKKGNLSIPNDINDLFIPAYKAGVRIHVDGWGSGSNAYTAEAAQIDKFIYWYPDFLPVFAAGNSGSGRGTLTAQANSKNALVIGSSQVPRPALDPESRFADQVAESSSRGPTGDNRIKPDLLAPGSALISACSSLVESNFTANSAYTRMGGSSMAAAVTGGALALLREQLTTRLDIADPSAALMRAALINGARSLPGDPFQQGFGILDSAGTALALRDETFKFSDEKSKLQEGHSLEYKIKVTDPSLPLKITLAWTDPPAATGSAYALVNNLDLAVADPNGKKYLGNDFNSQGKVDTLNNVEQVTIQVPKTGEYTISVRAGRIGQGGGQDFALVYGQALKTGIVKQVENNIVQMLDGPQVNLDAIAIHQVVDGVLNHSAAKIQVGSDIYLDSDNVYIFGQTWQTGGIQSLSTSGGDMILEMNSTVRQGGYYLDPRAASAPGAITVNRQSVASIQDIPSGSELKAAVNPALQTLWKLEAANQEITGVIGEVNPATQEIKLVGSGYKYKLASWAAITFRDEMIDCSAQNIPYGTGQSNKVDNLVPGTRVIMQVSPKGKVVQSLLVERSLIVGQIRSVDVASPKVTLDTGQTYPIYPGSSISRDQVAVSLSDLAPGDLVMAELLVNSQSVIELQAYSKVSYGRVVYASTGQKNLYMIDTDNSSHNYRFDKQTEVFGRGFQLESTSVASGSWVRVIADPYGNAAWRVDVAEVAEEKNRILAAVEASSSTLRMTDGSQYIYNASTRVSKGGFSIDAVDLMPGERALITTLAAPAPWSQQLAGVEVQVRSDIKLPVLRLTASALNGVLIIQGFTNGDRLYLYRKDGSFERMVVKNGLITGLYGLLDNETDLRALALDTTTGGMRSMDVKISTFASSPAAVSFSDTAGHWAEAAITALAQRNILRGFGDGSFRPDQSLSRAELAAIVARLQKLDPAIKTDPSIYSDYYDIPWWALEAVLAVREAGLIKGSPDGRFIPSHLVTRSEMEAVVAHIKNLSNGELSPPTASQPDPVITRAQAAAMLYQL